jgi:hypothetical protein
MYSDDASLNLNLYLNISLNPYFGLFQQAVLDFCV